MRGYHYTSWENWQRIKREGLKPYDLENTAARNTTPGNRVEKGTKGIWTWVKPLRGSSEFGQVVWAFVRRGAEKVVRLSYDYEESDVYPRGPNRSWTWRHKLSISTSYNETVYHKKAPAHVLLEPVPPDRIKCERIFEITSTEP